MGIQMEANTYADVNAARSYLVLQQDQTHDPKLRAMLGQRIGRLEGLISLRDAQTTFERRYGKQLENPADLLSRGILPQFPLDPIGLGYVFGDGQFSLKEIKFQGMEKANK